MKAWKIIKWITIIILLVFMGFLIFDAIKCYTANISYPTDAMGIDINSWSELFLIHLGFILVMFGLPLLIDVILLIISIIMIPTKENNNKKTSN